MKIYLPTATRLNIDGDEEILRGEKSEKMFDAYRTLKGWMEEFGERFVDKEIEVYGKVRKLYTNISDSGHY